MTAYRLAWFVSRERRMALAIGRTYVKLGRWNRTRNQRRWYAPLPNLGVRP